MNRPGGRHVWKVLAVLAVVGVLAMVGVTPASAALPTTQLDRKADACDPTTGTWTLHWFVTNSDSTNVRAQISFPGLGDYTASPSVIYPNTTSHLLVPGVRSGWSGTGTVTITWQDYSEPHTGTVIISLGTCAQATTTTAPSPPATTVPGKPGATVPGGGATPTTLQGARDPSNSAPSSTDVPGQTNGSDVAVDPASGAVTSTTAAGDSTGTSEASVLLAAGPASSSSSGSSGTIWIVLAIFVVAAAGGAVMLVMSRRSATASDDATDS